MTGEKVPTSGFFYVRAFLHPTGRYISSENTARHASTREVVTSQLQVQCGKRHFTSTPQMGHLSWWGNCHGVHSEDAAFTLLYLAVLVWFLSQSQHAPKAPPCSCLRKLLGRCRPQRPARWHVLFAYTFSRAACSFSDTTQPHPLLTGRLCSAIPFVHRNVPRRQ